MNFQLSEKRLAIQQAVREFAENELAPGVIERDEAGEYPLELYKKLGKMGYVGLPYEEKYGGSGGDYLDYAIAVEENVWVPLVLQNRMQVPTQADA